MLQRLHNARLKHTLSLSKLLDWNVIGFILINMVPIDSSKDEKISEEESMEKSLVSEEKETVGTAVTSSREQCESVSLICSLFTLIYSEYKYLPPMFSVFISFGLLAA